MVEVNQLTSSGLSGLIGVIAGTTACHSTSWKPPTSVYPNNLSVTLMQVRRLPLVQSATNFLGTEHGSGVPTVWNLVLGG
jgi:hypothetical protein